MPLGFAVVVGAADVGLAVAGRDRRGPAEAGVWFVFPGLIGFFIYFVSGVAETNRNPFDLPEAESELVGGFHTEYSGMKFAFFFLAEYANMLVGLARWR